MSTRPTNEADDLELYRRAADDALQQVDWYIGYLHAIGKQGEAQMLGRNRQTIRTQLLNRKAEPVPAGANSAMPRQR